MRTLKTRPAINVKPVRRVKPRVSTSFSEVEVRLVCMLLDRIARKGDVVALLRNPAYVSVAHKFLTMRNATQRHMIADELSQTRGAP